MLVFHAFITKVENPMRLTLPSIGNIEESGFGSSEDIFKRQAFGQQISNLILNTEENMVMALDSNWGQGKSTFIRMWKKHNEALENPLTTVYFDAFENDYQQDAFLALASEVYDALHIEDESSKSEFKERVANVAKAFGRSAFRIGARAITAGLVDDTALESAEEEIASAITGNVETYISEKLENNASDRLALHEFRSFLADTVKNNTPNHKLVFIIDELDRCRPDFALEIIEKIKHLFSVEGLTFLLVMNRNQLEESVKCKYGAGIEAQMYLQKFINIWLHLPEIKKTEYGYSDKVKFLNYAIDKMNCELLVQNEITRKVLSELIEANNTSFREIERIMTQLAILDNVQQRTIRYNYVYQLALAGLCFIKVNEPKLYLDFINKNISSDIVLKRLNIEQNPSTQSGALASMIVGVLADEATLEAMIEAKELPVDDFRGFNVDIFVNVNEPLNNFSQL